VATFKKKPISAQAVAMAEANASRAPLVSGTPQLAIAQPDSVVTNLGSSQDGPATTPLAGQIVHAPLGQVRSNPYNPRALYTAAAVDAMAISLSTHGQRVAALGYLDGDGHVVLIEGETRLRGARAAGLETLRVELRPRPDSDREHYEIARAANVERRDQTPLDDAIRWHELLAKKIYPSQVALGKALGVREDEVSRVLGLATLPQRVLWAVAEFPELMTLKMLNALREFHDQQGDEEAVLDLIHEAGKSGLGYRDVVARRKAAAKGPVRRPRSLREPLVYAAAKGEVKTFEEEGRLELVLKGLDADQAARLVERFKAILASPAAAP
jgi:ParB family transcriptional regulator, chromosome partitioning protein